MATKTIKDGVMYHVLTKELYVKHKKDGWNDRRIMSRYGFNSQSLNQWKKNNLSVEERTNSSLKKRISKVTEQDVKKSLGSTAKQPDSDDKQEEHQTDWETQYKRMYIEYRQLAEANEELKKEIRYLHSACDDLENDHASFEAVETLQKEIEHLRSLLDDKRTKEILGNVEEERRRQSKLWGKQSHDYSYWLTILIEEIGEVAQAIQKGSVASKISDAGDLYMELIQTAAVTVAFAEQVAEQVAGGAVGK